MTDTLESLRDTNKSMEATIKRTQVEIAKLEEDKKNFDALLKEETRRRDLVGVHLNAVHSKLAEINNAIAAARKANVSYAAEIARIQLEATRRIDARVGVPD